MRIEFIFAFLFACVLVRLISKKQKPNKGIDNISLKDLSTVWTKYNKQQAITKENEANSDMEPEETEVNQEGGQALYRNILQTICKSINIPNKKGVYEIFSLNGLVYIHTSGLTKIVKDLTGETDKETLKNRIKEVSEKFIEARIAKEGFCKYSWESKEGKKGKSLYLEVAIADYFPEIATDTSNIISMEKEKSDG